MSRQVPGNLRPRASARPTAGTTPGGAGARLALVAAGLVLAGGLTVLGLMHARAAALQRLCEHSDQAVAKISPCTGRPGTTITLTMQRTLDAPPAKLVFKRVLAAAGVQGAVTTPIRRLTATVPRQLCVQVNEKWEVWLVDATNTSQGLIGAFWPDCRGITNANANTNANTIVWTDPPVGNSNGGNGNAGNGNVNGGGGAGNVNGDKPGGGPIDPCLVGTWQATRVTADNPRITGGGEGFVVTFRKDGTETVDYSSMRPFRMGDDETTYTGSATARISTEDKTARVLSVEKKGVVVNFSKLVPIPGRPLPGLGFGGLGETSDDNGYACTKDSLEYKGSMSLDRRPNVSVKLTRRKN